MSWFVVKSCLQRRRSITWLHLLLIFSRTSQEEEENRSKSRSFHSFSLPYSTSRHPTKLFSLQLDYLPSSSCVSHGLLWSIYNCSWGGEKDALEEPLDKKERSRSTTFLWFSLLLHHVCDSTRYRSFFEVLFFTFSVRAFLTETTFKYNTDTDQGDNISRVRGEIFILFMIISILHYSYTLIYSPVNQNIQFLMRVYHFLQTTREDRDLVLSFNSDRSFFLCFLSLSFSFFLSSFLRSDLFSFLSGDLWLWLWLFFLLLLSFDSFRWLRWWRDDLSLSDDERFEVLSTTGDGGGLLSWGDLEQLLFLNSGDWGLLSLSSSWISKWSGDRDVSLFFSSGELDFTKFCLSCLSGDLEGGLCRTGLLSSGVLECLLFLSLDRDLDLDLEWCRGLLFLGILRRSVKKASTMAS